jgi:hypothetical protein
MPIESPILDDLDFNTLNAFLRNQIPIYAPEWTDHNDSDPGITLIQLFAYLAEQIGYRLNQVPLKNYIEFLKLIGIQLRPAEPPSTTMSFVLTKPEMLDQFLIPAGARIKAKTETEEPPVFETDRNLDVVPAQLAALVTTRSDKLTQINLATESGPTSAGEDPENYVAERFSLVWDGKTPKLKDLPVNPLPFFQRPTEQTHMHLWIGLAFNPAVTAGFLGARITLTVQLDDDEQPASDAVAQCGGPELELIDLSDPDGELVAYAYYRPPQIGEPAGSWHPLAVIADDTQGWTRSGRVRFDVPLRMGPIPDGEWQDIENTKLQNVETDLPHPLIGALKSPVEGTPELAPVSGWIHVEFKTVSPALLLRALSFNVVTATNVETVRDEQLGRGTGEPGQRLRLANGNVLPDTLDLITVGPEPAQETIKWQPIPSFDTAGPFDRVYCLDPEAGEIVFGSGIHGQIPAESERIIALFYQHGGSKEAEVAMGAVSQPDSLPAPVEAAVNIVAARGGKDAETLEEAKLRAPTQLKVQNRAVTEEDFEFHTLQTRGLRVRRAITVPLHIPFPEGSFSDRGLDLNTRVPGALTVIVIPDQEGLHPTPTKGMLRTVCRHLDRYRLITTEVYTAAPQYVRLFDLQIELKAAPGFTRTLLREAVAEHLESYFHVLAGGEDGVGFPFGVTVHHADLVAQVFRVNGVERVEDLVAWYDGNSPDRAIPSMSWRTERAVPRRLTNCGETETDDEKIVLMADETVFIDSSTLNIRITGG